MYKLIFFNHVTGTNYISNPMYSYKENITPISTIGLVMLFIKDLILG